MVGRVFRSPFAATATALVAGLLAVVFVGRLEASGHLVSQKGRAFQPNSLVITRGDTITIVNDDSDLLHHIYIESDAFNFDSGDQVPGSRTPVTFEKNGTFVVLCGIHPKMKLIVRVN
ncbi:plastocyanin [Methylobacterium sp. WL120]|uniref:plastocyanin n=1 Tax=Methylobacterium sp. WL120 TaxID=2603887 RepID=UPI0011CCC29F|nr:plastocyanin [Methylobacterium sp. WL120]TXM64813.1 plastocyanin [Methylobacterium sp. WL120]